MKSLIVILTSFISITSLATTEVRETKSFMDIIAGARKAVELTKQKDPSYVLVAFDIDDTLLIVTHCTDESWFKRAFKCPTEMTSPQTSDAIKGLQSDGFGTVAITARGSFFKSATTKQLANHDISFLGMPFTSEFDFKEVVGEKGKVDFTSGVAHAGSKNKGQVLAHIQSYLADPYKVVVFADDNSKNIKAMDEWYRDDQNTHVIIYHYKEHRDH